MLPAIKRRFAFLAIFAICLTVAVLPGQEANAQYERGNVWGQIVDRQGRPMEGITVYLIHTQIGRSYPRYTDFEGFYRFENIPVPPGDPFWIEVYWGRELMFRDVIRRLGPQPPINLY
jgi:hypothetical protein